MNSRWAQRGRSLPGLAFLLLLLPSPSARAQGGASPPGVAPLSWAECRDDQVEVLLLGTFHFHQTKAVNVLEARRQQELARILSELEAFAPDAVAVEYPWAEQAKLDEDYQIFLDSPDPSRLRSKNEVFQVGFRLARQVGLPSVAAVDVPMNLWDDAIAEYDERFPKSRKQLRKRWKFDLGPRNDPDDALGLAEMLIRLNRDVPAGNEELYGNFLPLVVEDIYVGALKLRPWYDRNLRMVQNLFRHADPAMDRIVFVVGASHVRVLKQIMEMTPQLCPVDPVPLLTRAAQPAGADDRPRGPSNGV